jgi:hypothetical protein
LHIRVDRLWAHIDPDLSLYADICSSCTSHRWQTTASLLFKLQYIHGSNRLPTSLSSAVNIKRSPSDISAVCPYNRLSSSFSKRQARLAFHLFAFAKSLCAFYVLLPKLFLDQHLTSGIIRCVAWVGKFSFSLEVISPSFQQRSAPLDRSHQARLSQYNGFSLNYSHIQSASRKSYTFAKLSHFTSCDCNGRSYVLLFF